MRIATHNKDRDYSQSSLRGLLLIIRLLPWSQSLLWGLWLIIRIAIMIVVLIIRTATISSLTVLSLCYSPLKS